MGSKLFQLAFSFNKAAKDSKRWNKVYGDYVTIIFVLFIRLFKTEFCP